VLVRAAPGVWPWVVGLSTHAAGVADRLAGALSRPKVGRRWCSAQCITAASRAPLGVGWSATNTWLTIAPWRRLRGRSGQQGAPRVRYGQRRMPSANGSPFSPDHPPPCLGQRLQRCRLKPAAPPRLTAAVSSIPNAIYRAGLRPLRHPCCPIYPRHLYLPKGAKGAGAWRSR
jgi:hypothetical protein